MTFSIGILLALFDGSARSKPHQTQRKIKQNELFKKLKILNKKLGLLCYFIHYFSSFLLIKIVDLQNQIFRTIVNIRELSDHEWHKVINSFDIQDHFVRVS